MCPGIDTHPADHHQAENVESSCVESEGVRPRTARRESPTAEIAQSRNRGISDFENTEIWPIAIALVTVAIYFVGKALSIGCGAAAQ